MWGYFKPLRKKIGLFALIVSCVATALWIQAEYIRAADRPLRVHVFPGLYIQLVVGMNAEALGLELLIAGHRVYPLIGFDHWPSSIYVSLYASMLSAYLLFSKHQPTAKV